MKKLDSLANDMIYGDIVQKIAKDRNINMSEARNVVSGLSFKDYQVLEATVPAPSGQTIGPTGTTQPETTAGAAGAGTAGAPTYVKGVPPKEGQSVSVKNRSGVPIQGTIKRVDQMKNGVLVFNPETQKEEWMNIGTLEPFMVGAAPKPAAPGQPGNQTDQQNVLAQTGKVAEDRELGRLLTLAGIQENCSGGATGAGAIAVAAKPLGEIKRREPTEAGSLKKEYTPKAAAKTIIGDTKPNQASGKLSADLAATGKKSAGRNFNGSRGKRVR